MCVSVSSVSSPLTVSVSPAAASPGRPMVTVTLPSSSISAAEMYSSPSPMLTVGAAGAVVSMVSSPSAVPVLPASSVATTSTVWALSSSASGQVSDQVPSPLLVASWVAPSMVTSTVASGSSMVPLSSGVVSLVTRSLTVTTGAVVSIVRSPVAVPVLPASSVATTSTVWALSSSASGQVSDQVPSPLLVASWVAPSMVTSTVASGSSMVPLSSGVVSLVTRSLTVTTGAVVSTVALAVPGSLSLPAASVTVAVTSSGSPSPGAAT